jgi:hypothetical protein
MKLRDIQKGTRAVKPVQFRLANAPPLAPGEDTDEHTITVGVRILTPHELEQLYENAIAAAVKNGVPQWLDTHPLCRLHEMRHAVLLACVDYDSPERAEPFFVSMAELSEHPGMGGDNLAYLFAQWRLWQDEVSPQGKQQTPGELIALILEEAGRPENSPDSPFLRLSPSAQRRCFHSTAVLLATSLTDRSDSSSQVENSSAESSIPSAPPPSAKRRQSKTKARKRGR